MRIDSKVGLLSLSVAIVATACGGRSTGETLEHDNQINDAGGVGGNAGDGARADAASADARADTRADADVPADADSDVKDLFDALPPLPEGGPLGACSMCLQGRCGDSINACYNNQNCVAGIQCMAINCLGSSGGEIDPECALPCFHNDISAAMLALSAFTCMTQTCGGPCGAAMIDPGDLPFDPGMIGDEARADFSPGGNP